MASIALESVVKEYGSQRAISELTLGVEDGEFLVLVGPSGCGKSTLLRSIGGLETITSGRVLIGDRDVTRLDPGARDLAMVFQNYSLYPHLDVRRNLAFGLRFRKTARAEVDRRVQEAAELLGLGALLDRRPAELSGGQRQRVAIGRAIVREPLAFLMDEPLSNLDAQLRTSMRVELSRLHQRLGATVVYVTHDQVEAMTLGQRIAVLKDGVLQQVGTPRALYDVPANLFVASFIGSPKINAIEAVVEDGRAHFGGHSLPVGADVPKGPLTLGIRPEAWRVVPAAGEEPVDGSLEVELTLVEDLGSEQLAFFAVDALQPEAVEPSWLVARVDRPRGLTAGARVRLVVDRADLYFFDARSGENLRSSSCDAKAAF